MRCELHAAALLGAFSLAAAPAAAQTYAYDDGEADKSIGLGSIGINGAGDLAWFQHFHTGDKVLAGDLFDPHTDFVTIRAAQRSGYDRQDDQNSGSDRDLALARHISILDN